MKQFLTESIQNRFNIVVEVAEINSKDELLGRFIQDCRVPLQSYVMLVGDNEPLWASRNLQYIFSNGTANENLSDAIQTAIQAAPDYLFVTTIDNNTLDILHAMNLNIPTVTVVSKLDVMVEDLVEKFPLMPSDYICKMIQNTVDIVVQLETDKVTVKMPLYNETTGTLDMIPLCEEKNGLTQKFNVSLKPTTLKKITNESSKEEFTEEVFEEVEQLEAMDTYIPTIDYDKFYQLFEEKTYFKKWQQLAPLLKETISIVRTPEVDDNIPVGASKFGGNPDLPTDISYPFYTNDIAYSFLMQINCEDAAKYDHSGRLPKTGMLYFFHLFTDGELSLHFDFEEENNSNAFLKTTKIMYYPGGKEQLQRLDKPENEHIEPIKSAKIDFVRSLTLKKPFENENDFEKCGFPVKTDEELHQILSDLHFALPRLVFEEPEDVLAGDLNTWYNRPFHQLFGEPQHEQAPPLDVLEHHFQKVGVKKEEWTLLFQLWGDEETVFLNGNLHFFIKETDLKEIRFNEVYHLYECD